jgi:hypothetical protein
MLFTYYGKQSPGQVPKKIHVSLAWPVPGNISILILNHRHKITGLFCSRLARNQKAWVTCMDKNPELKCLFPGWSKIKKFW